MLNLKSQKVGTALAAIAVLGIALTQPASAFTPIANPDAAYVGGTTLLPITVGDGAAVPSLTDGIMTMTISPSSVARTVPGGGWATWAAPPFTETSTPRVLADYFSTMVTLTLSQTATTFGFEAEPDPFGFFDITADFYLGGSPVGSITRSIDGFAGARLLAASDPLGFDKVVVSSSADFGMAQFRYASAAPVPEPTTMALLGSGALGLIGKLRRRKTEGEAVEA